MDRFDEIDLILTSSDEEEIHRPRTVKFRNNLFEELDHVEFKNRFRLDKNTVLFLANLLELVIEPVNDRNHPVSKLNQILICLRYYASGTFQINVGDHFNVSQPTVSRIVTKITRHIAGLRPQFICMPHNEVEKRQTVEKFYNIAGLPGVIGWSFNLYQL